MTTCVVGKSSASSLSGLITNRSRVVVVGTSGSGKSTLARRLARRFGLKDIELDALFWQPNWRENDPQVFRANIQREIAGAAGFVIHGNYKKHRDLIWGACDTLIWLDYSRMRTLWRVFQRTVGRVVTRTRLWQGNREGFRKAFLSRDSIIAWSWRTYRPNRSVFTKLSQSPLYQIQDFLIVRTPNAAKYLTPSP